MKLDRFTVAYITAALWSTNDESDPSGGEPLDRNYDIEDIDQESLDRIVADCESFQAKMYDLFTWEQLDDACLMRFNCEEQAGHDFWLTRNGHGCGFWETSDWQESVGSKLNQLAHDFGECGLYVGDDNKIHLA